jgi:type IV secretion system protein VirD4
MSSFRFAVVHVSLTGADVFLCLAAAAQWAAAMLAYQLALGAPVIDLFEVDLYVPWKLFTWWLAFDSQAPDVFARAGILAALDGVLSGALAIGGVARRADRPRVPTTYGSARWADFDDVPILWRPAIPARCAQLSGASIQLGRAEFVGHYWPPTNLLFVPLTSCGFPPFPIVSPRQR